MRPITHSFRVAADMFKDTSLPSDQMYSLASELSMDVIVGFKPLMSVKQDGNTKTASGTTYTVSKSSNVDLLLTLPSNVSPYYNMYGFQPFPDGLGFVYSDTVMSIDGPVNGDTRNFLYFGYTISFKLGATVGQTYSLVLKESLMFAFGASQSTGSVRTSINFLITP